jgi:hypothetical protein
MTQRLERGGFRWPETPIEIGSVAATAWIAVASVVNFFAPKVCGWECVVGGGILVGGGTWGVVKVIEYRRNQNGPYSRVPLVLSYHDWQEDQL